MPSPRTYPAPPAPKRRSGGGRHEAPRVPGTPGLGVPLPVPAGRVLHHSSFDGDPVGAILLVPLPLRPPSPMTRTPTFTARQIARLRLQALGLVGARRGVGSQRGGGAPPGHAGPGLQGLPLGHPIPTPGEHPAVLALAAFDEHLLGYRVRDCVPDPGHAPPGGPRAERGLPLDPGGGESGRGHRVPHPSDPPHAGGGDPLHSRPGPGKGPPAPSRPGGASPERRWRCAGAGTD